jgi:alpha-beta hydrolase superfamily lysophospholipase
MWVFIVQFILINISSALYAHRLTYFYDEVAGNAPLPSQNVFGKTWKLFTGPKTSKSVIHERPAFNYDTVSLHTASGIPIDAWYSRSDTNARGTVILFHGITVNKAILLQEANEFRFWGFDVMLVDFRAHGNSGGNITTIGIRESEEVKLAFDYIKTQRQQPIYLYGVSLGSVAISRAIFEYQLKPTAVILDMPFESLQSYLKAKARLLGFPQQPFAFLTTFWIGAERGFNGFKHETTRYVSSIQCPVLMQWGSADPFVLNKETNDIFGAIGTASKKLVIYPGAGHESLLLKDPLKWRIEVGKLLGVE